MRCVLNDCTCVHVQLFLEGQPYCNKLLYSVLAIFAHGSHVNKLTNLDLGIGILYYSFPFRQPGSSPKYIYLSHECKMTFCILAIYNDNPLPFRLYTNPWPYYRTRLFFRIGRGFHRTFAMYVACRQGTLTPPDTWPRPIWDLHMFYLRSILFQNLSLFFRTMHFGQPSVLSRFCFIPLIKTNVSCKDPMNVIILLR